MSYHIHPTAKAAKAALTYHISSIIDMMILSILLLASLVLCNATTQRRLLAVAVAVAAAAGGGGDRWRSLVASRTITRG